jgi:hypothetical protein
MNFRLTLLTIGLVVLSGVAKAADIYEFADILRELEVDNHSLPHGAKPTEDRCINGYGREEEAWINPGKILAGANYLPRQDGYLVFDLPVGYVTDAGSRVNLKNEVTIYQEGKKDLELIRLSEVDGVIYVSVINYLIMSSGRKCVEVRFTLHSKNR